MGNKRIDNDALKTYSLPMLRLLNYMLVFVLVAASSPDEVLGFCFENCKDSVSQFETVSKISVSKLEKKQKNSDSHPDHDCNCPVHSHHCCNHVSFVSFSYPSAKNVFISAQNVNHLYVESFLSEPALDGLLRPPIS